METSRAPSNVPHRPSDLTLAKASPLHHLLSSVWLHQDALKPTGASVQHFPLCRFDREAQLLPVALTHNQQCHAGAFTGFFHLTFDANALHSQLGSTAANGTQLLHPVIIDLGFKRFSLVEII